MIESMTPDELVSMSRLMSNADFRMLLNWTKRSLDEVKTNLVTAPIQMIPDLQGQAKVLTSFLEHTENFPSELRKLALQESRKNTGLTGS
jgi:hypothetical protein